MRKNEERILSEQKRLQEAGLLDPTDELHTKSFWQARGFSVKKDEEPKAEVKLWIIIKGQIRQKKSKLYATSQTDYKEKLQIED